MGSKWRSDRLGDPAAASRRRILAALLHRMQRRKAKKGLASLCTGGGMDATMVLQRD